MAKDVRTDTTPYPAGFLPAAWVLEDSPETPERDDLIRRLGAAGCPAGLCWTIALSWKQLLPSVRRLFRSGERDLYGWLHTLFLFWPQVLI